MAATIEVGEVTLSPDGTPSVTNTGTESAAVFDFEIPQSLGMSVFGGRYNNAVATSDLEADVPALVTMPTTTAARNATYTTADSITVSQDGSYLILYSIAPSFTAAATLTLAVRNNGVNMPSTQNVVTLPSAATVNYAGNTIVALTAGETVDISITSDTAQTINYNAASLNTLNLMKLD